LAAGLQPGEHAAGADPARLRPDGTLAGPGPVRGLAGPAGRRLPARAGGGAALLLRQVVRDPHLTRRTRKDRAMIHPDTELRFIDREVGHGVFATRFIPRGTITWALDEFDQLLAPAQVAALAPAQRAQVEEYAYVDARGNYVLCWDLGRYVNHGCDPTSRGIGPAFEIAVRDIQPGEQLTSDYAELNITAAFRCRCGSPRCRGVIRADDLLRHGH